MLDGKIGGVLQWKATLDDDAPDLVPHYGREDGFKFGIGPNVKRDDLDLPGFAEQLNAFEQRCGERVLRIEQDGDPGVSPA